MFYEKELERYLVREVVMIVKIRCENQWTYIADVRRVKTEDGQKDGKTCIMKMYVFYNTDDPFELIEVNGNPVYLLTNEGKTIERIN